MTATPSPLPRRSAASKSSTPRTNCFTQRGIRAVGVDEVIARSGVAKATLYKHFRSKNDLALAFLERREQRWTLDFLEAGSAKRPTIRGSTARHLRPARRVVPPERVLRRVLVHERPARDGHRPPVGQACVRHLANIRGIVARRAAAAGLADPGDFAKSFHILMEGSFIAAIEGDSRAARARKTWRRC